MTGTSCRIGILLAIPMTPAFAQEHWASDSFTEEVAIKFAGTWVHGASSIPSALRDSIVSDTVVLRLYSDLLLGRRNSDLPWDPSTAMYFLAMSGDPQWIPVLDLYTRDPPRPCYDGCLPMAAYGLALHPGDSTATARLEELAVAGTYAQRHDLIGALTLVRDSSALALLAQMNTAGLTASDTSRIRHALEEGPQ